MDCLFCKIAQGQIPVERVLEDEHGLAFPDINPQAPVHLLVIPKQHLASLADCKDFDLIGRLHALGVRAAAAKGIAETGFRVVTNTGKDANQTVFHLHLHVIGGRAMGWPPG